jgi:16S rRNA (guanine966-N2)-methyltransferase
MARKRVRRRPAHREGKPHLRVIGGQWRSRVLPVADRPGLRPTPNRVRETLFNWLAPHLPGAYCLDLFAGTGALGIEALSRGAAHATFIENDRQAAATIEAALAALQAGGRGHVVVADGTRAADSLSGAPADLVFIDPPFDSGLYHAALTGLRPLVKSSSRIYLEYPVHQEEAVTAQLTGAYELLRQKRAGEVGYLLARPRHTGEHDAHE